MRVGLSRPLMILADTLFPLVIGTELCFAPGPKQNIPNIRMIFIAKCMGIRFVDLNTLYLKNIDIKFSILWKKTEGIAVIDMNR